MISKDRFGSNCEELNVSKPSPLRTRERTSMMRAATSLMGHNRTCGTIQFLCRNSGDFHASFKASARGLT